MQFSALDNTEPILRYIRAQVASLRTAVADEADSFPPASTQLPPAAPKDEAAGTVAGCSLELADEGGGSGLYRHAITGPTAAHRVSISLSPGKPGSADIQLLSHAPGATAGRKAGHASWDLARTLKAPVLELKSACTAPAQESAPPPACCEPQRNVSTTLVDASERATRSYVKKLIHGQPCTHALLQLPLPGAAALTPCRPSSPEAEACTRSICANQAFQKRCDQVCSASPHSVCSAGTFALAVMHTAVFLQSKVCICPQEPNVLVLLADCLEDGQKRARQVSGNTDQPALVHDTH